MENITAKIWDYIDGDMKGDQKVEFERLLKNDEKVNVLYKHLLSIHRQLSSIPLKKAPDALSQNVLNAIKTKPSYLSKYDSFFGLNFLLGGLLIIGALVSLVFMITLDVPSGEVIPYKDTLMNLFSFDFLRSSTASHVLPYTLVLLSGLFLFWVDSYLQKHKVSKAYLL